MRGAHRHHRWIFRRGRASTEALRIRPSVHSFRCIDFALTPPLRKTLACAVRGGKVGNPFSTSVEPLAAPSMSPWRDLVLIGGSAEAANRPILNHPNKIN